MTDYRSLYDKDYIGAWDLNDGDMTILITRVIGGSLVGQGGRKSKKPIVYMQGTEKGFAVNSTNGKAIAAMYGNHVEKWVGKKITLYKSTTRNPNGEGDVECIRVRPQIPSNSAPAPAAGSHTSSPDASGAEDAGAPLMASPEQIEAMHAALSENNVEIGKLLAKAEIQSLSDMPADDVPGAVRWIKKQGAKK